MLKAHSVSVASTLHAFLGDKFYPACTNIHCNNVAVRTAFGPIQIHFKWHGFCWLRYCVSLLLKALDERTVVINIVITYITFEENVDSIQIS